MMGQTVTSVTCMKLEDFLHTMVTKLPYELHGLQTERGVVNQFTKDGFLKYSYKRINEYNIIKRNSSLTDQGYRERQVFAPSLYSRLRRHTRQL